MQSTARASRLPHVTSPPCKSTRPLPSRHVRGIQARGRRSWYLHGGLLQRQSCTCRLGRLWLEALDHHGHPRVPTSTMLTARSAPLLQPCRAATFRLRPLPGVRTSPRASSSVHWSSKSYVSNTPRVPLEYPSSATVGVRSPQALFDFISCCRSARGLARPTLVRCMHSSAGVADAGESPHSQSSA